MYKQAAVKKLRFATPKGSFMIEDLFDLPLTSTTGRPNLNDLAVDLYKQAQASGDVPSFVDAVPKTAESDAALALELVKDVIAYKIAARDVAAKKAEKAATRQKIMALIDQKKDAALGDKSVEDLTALLASLSD